MTSESAADRFNVGKGGKVGNGVGVIVAVLVFVGVMLGVKEGCIV
jgi:hypothetical protein